MTCVDVRNASPGAPGAERALRAEPDRARVPYRWWEWPMGQACRLFDRVQMRCGHSKCPTHRHAPQIRDFRKLADVKYLDNPGLFYAVDAPIEDVRTTGTEVLRDGVVTEAVEYPTNFPFGPAANNTGYGLHVRCPRGTEAIASMLFIAGWGRQDFRTELFCCRRFARCGIESLILVMPFHMKRCPPGYWSGEWMLSGDVVRTAICFQQMVAELRGLVPYLRRFTDAVGIIGISLGGILAQSAMAVHPYDFGINMISGGEAACIAWEGAITRYVRRDIQAAGIGPAELDRIWMAASPTKFARHNKTHPILMIAGKYDQIVPARYAVGLWEALGRPRIRWYPCAHYSSLFFLPWIVRDIVEFVTGAVTGVPVLSSDGGDGRISVLAGG